MIALSTKNVLKKSLTQKVGALRNHKHKVLAGGGEEDVDEVRGGADLAAQRRQVPDLLGLGGGGFGEGADQGQPAEGGVAAGLGEEGVAELLEEEDEHVEDVGTDARRGVGLAQGDEDVKEVAVEEIFHAGCHVADGAGLGLLLLHQDLEHSIEVECQFGVLDGLFLELRGMLCYVVAEEEIPVVFEIL